MATTQTSAGTLDRRVTLQRPAAGQDAAGQPVTGWVDHLANIAANIRYQTGLETLKADAVTAALRASVRIRYRSGLDNSMRVIIDGSPFDIRSIQPNGRRQWLDLVCERAV